MNKKLKRTYLDNWNSYNFPKLGTIPAKVGIILCDQTKKLFMWQQKRKEEEKKKSFGELHSLDNNT